MKISVVRADNRVIVDGVGADVDCSDLSGHVRAIHWCGDACRGEIEFEPDAAGVRIGWPRLSSRRRRSSHDQAARAGRPALSAVR